ncbi:uncharacterized protein LOC115885234 [Sitophilus oryzae]|uniref:Uncharacterized protein LOC115885234 n=1 Tax=Sitophilus oryzae TaxID=7048 RepID=A0A6J2Y9L6_SITOR|nr:uncharacterized protein LOC115885234 [Sitophilus oryzae]
MDQVNSETEKLSTYETSRTCRSLVEEKIKNSENEDENEMSGFYVREKTAEISQNKEASNGDAHEEKEDNVSVEVPENDDKVEKDENLPNNVKEGDKIEEEENNSKGKYQK